MRARDRIATAVGAYSPESLAYSARTSSPLISPRSWARLDDPGCASSTCAGCSATRGRPPGVRRRPPARRDLPRSRRRAGGRARAGSGGPPPLPDPADFARRSRGPASARTTSSSPTTTSAAGSPPGCGGCSTTSAIAAARRSSTAGSRPGRGRRPAHTDGPATPAPAAIELADHWTNVIERDDLRERLGEVVLLDARGAPRYRGEVEPIDAYPGHIPTAVNAPTDGNLVEPNGRFRSPAELRAVREPAFGGRRGRRAQPAAPVVTSCGSGVSACHASLAMRLAGLPDPILYVGSYSDWSRAGEAVATGPEPGAPPDR